MLLDARICIRMPSPTSHALQALDRSIFGALKKLVRKILARYEIEHQRLQSNKQGKTLRHLRASPML